MSDRDIIGRLERPTWEELEADPSPLFRPNDAAQIDSTRSWVDPNGYRLSDRVWSAKASDRKALDKTLQASLAQGTGPEAAAKAVERYMTPAGSEMRSRSPRAGMGNYAARRLARTETTRAFGDASLKSGLLNPFQKGIKWLLSGGHKDLDMCDSHASGNSRGFNRGEYLISEVPSYPNHPNELCTLSPVAVDDEEAEAILAGMLPPEPPSIEDQFLAMGAPSSAELGQSFAALDDILRAKKLLDEATSTAMTPIGDLITPGMRHDEANRLLLERSAAQHEALQQAEQAVREAGAIARKEIVGSLDESDRNLLLNYADAKAARESTEKAMHDLYKRMSSEEDDLVFEALQEQYRVRRDITLPKLRGDEDRAKLAIGDARVADVYRDATTDYMQKVRGGSSWRDHDYDPLSDSDAIEPLVRHVRSIVPREWWDASIDAGPLRVNMLGSGADLPSGMRRQSAYYRNAHGDTPATIVLRGPDSYVDEIAVHEFMHRVEATRPAVQVAQRGFYERRTEGESLTPLGGGYDEHEETRLDRFASPYMGKEYGGGSYELLTMGAQDLYRGGPHFPSWLLDDDDFADFIVGLIMIG